MRKPHSPQCLNTADAGPQGPRTTKGAGRLPEPRASQGPGGSPELPRGQEAARATCFLGPPVAATTGLGGATPTFSTKASPLTARGPVPHGGGSLPGITLSPEGPFRGAPGSPETLLTVSVKAQLTEREPVTCAQTSSSLSETTLRTSARELSCFLHLRGRLALSSWEHHRAIV